MSCTRCPPLFEEENRVVEFFFRDENVNLLGYR